MLEATDGFGAVSVESLRERLRRLLAADSLLARRFDAALASRDPARVEAAFDALALYPPLVRREVEDAILGWLLDGGARLDCVDPPGPPSRPHRGA